METKEKTYEEMLKLAAKMEELGMKNLARAQRNFVLMKKSIDEVYKE